MLPKACRNQPNLKQLMALLLDFNISVGLVCVK